MSISREDVQHIAQLARMRLTEAELAEMTDQLSGILGHIAVLQEADTSQTPVGASHLTPLRELRPDQSAPSFDPNILLANAPEREEDYLRVKAVME